MTKRLLLLVALLASAPTRGLAEPPAHQNLVGASVVGFAGFLRLNIGSYEVFYERRIGPFAVMANFDFIHVHQGDEHAGSHQWTFGGALTGRYFFAAVPGLFAGVRAGYRGGFGYYMKHDHTGAGERVELVSSQISILGQVGFRLEPVPRLRITTRVGLGYGPYTVTPKERSDAAALEAATVSRETLSVQPIVLDTELSVGLAF